MNDDQGMVDKDLNELLYDLLESVQEEVRIAQTPAEKKLALQHVKEAAEIKETVWKVDHMIHDSSVSEGKLALEQRKQDFAEKDFDFRVKQADATEREREWQHSFSERELDLKFRQLENDSKRLVLEVRKEDSLDKERAWSHKRATVQDVKDGLGMIIKVGAMIGLGKAIQARFFKEEQGEVESKADSNLASVATKIFTDLSFR